MIPSLACLFPTSVLNIYVFARHYDMVVGIQRITEINTMKIITNI